MGCNWAPHDNTWICSQHFVNGEKSNNPLVPNYCPTIFPQLQVPRKENRRMMVLDLRSANKQSVRSSQLMKSKLPVADLGG